jgi:cell shape-determining protein MreD
MNWTNTLFILALAYAGVFLESSFDFFRTVMGAQITVLPALMVYTSLTSGIGAVTLVAVSGGLLLDSLSANPLGVSILPLFLVGFLILRERDLLLREHQFAQVTLGVAAGALCPLATLFLLLNLGVSPLLGWRTLWQWIVSAVAGGVLTPLFFFLLERLGRAFEYQPLAQSSFRPDRQIKRGRS